MTGGWAGPWRGIVTQGFGAAGGGAFCALAAPARETTISMTNFAIFIPALHVIAYI